MTNTLIEKMASVLLLLFPAMLIAVPDGGSVIIVLLIIVSSAGLLLNRDPIPLNNNEKHLLIVTAIYILIYIFNVWLFNSKISELDNTSRFLLLLPIFFYFRKSKISPKSFYYGILIGTITCFTIASYQKFYLGVDRAYGITNWVSFGGLSITLAIMCLAIGSFSTTRRSKSFFYTGVVFAVWASVLSGSRGTWLVFLPCLIVWFFINPKSWSVKTRSMTAFISLLIIIVSYHLPVIKPRVDQAIVEVNSYYTNNTVNTSLGLRLEVWRASMISIIENPILGIGEGNFKNEMQQLSDQELIYPNITTKIAHVHNEYISAFLHRGIPGLLSLLLLFLIPLIAFSKALMNEKNKSEKIVPAIGVTLIISTMTFSLSDIFFSQHQYTIFFAAFIYVLYAFMNNHSTDNLRNT